MLVDHLQDVLYVRGPTEPHSHPVYQQLEVVREGGVVPGVEPVEGALYWATVTSLPFVLDRPAGGLPDGGGMVATP